MADTPPAHRYEAFIVAGATGVGKSAVAVELAELLDGEIVGADAFQVYAGLPLLTAQPPPPLRERVPHHLIGEWPLTESFDVAQYLRLATERLAEIRARGRRPIVVGGTGLYLRTLLRGLAELPPADLMLRAELEVQPLESLQARLRQVDPIGAEAMDLRNPRRVIRALEVSLLTGRPFSTFRREWSGTEPPCVRGVWLDREREEMHTRIDHRVEEMFEAGVLEEVAQASEVGATASQALGLREIRAHLEARSSRAECVQRIQQSTRQYAKRQATWLRREPELRRWPVGAGFAVRDLLPLAGGQAN